jgi:dienelactone hydrolase
VTTARIQVTGHESEGDGEVGERIALHTDQGDIGCLLLPAPGATAAVIWSGSWATYGGQERVSPITRSVSADLQADGISSLIVRYRKSRELPAAARDTEAGVLFLQEQGYQRIAVVGHSFAAAVAITAGEACSGVNAVVALASQTYGARPAAYLSPKPLLLVHGTEDTRLNVYCSEQIYSWAKQPKELVILEGASHGLSECSDTLFPLLRRWLTEKLAE